MTARQRHWQPVGVFSGGGCSVTMTLHVAHFVQSVGVVTCTLHVQPETAFAVQREPLSSEMSVAEQVPKTNPGSHVAGPKS